VSILRLILLLATLAPTLVVGGDMLSVSDAFTMATREEIILVDIRSHDEWVETGIASVARPVSMYERQFMTEFRTIAEEANGRPIALICATGGRTAWLQTELTRRGITNLVDVPEGMIGSAAGPGWLRTGLPVKPYPASDQPPGSLTYTFWERLTGSYRPPWIKDN
jgi:rhodanese-related sulfurtransferase